MVSHATVGARVFLAAGNGRLVPIVGPTGVQIRTTAKVADALKTESGMTVATVAKLQYELDRPHTDRSWFDCRTGPTVVVDEAAMLSTADLHREHLVRG